MAPSGWIGPHEALVLAGILGMAACGGGDDGPRWIHLAQNFEPSQIAGSGADWVTLFDREGMLHLTPEAEGSGVWIRVPIRKQDWRSSPWEGVFSTRRPLPGVGAPRDGSERQRLEAPGRTFQFFDFDKDLPDPNNAPKGSFSAVYDRLYLALEDGDELPDEAAFHLYVDRGQAVDGIWRTTIDRYTGDGIPVWPGQAEELVIDAPPSSALRFWTVGQSIGPAKEVPIGDLTFRVHIDGELALDHTQPVGSVPGRIAHTIALAPGGGLHSLRFEVAGKAALSGFFDPVVGPAEVGSHASRPWGEQQPDIILFLADTFRADNLTLHGGEGLAPNIDRLAAESRTYMRTWAPSPWTMPSQASMFTGLFPHQHGAVRGGLQMPSELRTLAEHLRDAGYRTGAITDQGYLTKATGFDQGFEWFRDQWCTIEETVEEAQNFLDADDGRPVFLFVQTYRSHVPYTVSAQTRAEWGDRYEFVDDFFGLKKRIFEALGENEVQPDIPPSLSRDIELFKNLYRGAVVDLDRGFGDLTRDLEQRGILDAGYLLFTSDHGESFFEHGTIGHGNGVWEEHIRIPLFVHGPGMGSDQVEHAASLVDLPRTVCDLARLRPDPSWLGQSLLHLDADRPAFAFECNNRGEASSLAVIEGDRKVIAVSDAAGLQAGGIEWAYALASDPAESSGLGPDAAWPGECLKRHSVVLEALFEPIVGPSGATLGPDERAALRALGYAGG